MKIHELLSSPDKWTKGSYARDKDGNPCRENSGNAVCFCLSGAGFHVYGDRPSEHMFVRTKLHNRLYEMRRNDCILMFNDDPKTTYEDVYNLVKELDV